MGVRLRVLLDGTGDAAIGVAFTQHRIDCAAEHLRVPRLDISLGIALRFFRVIGQIVALRLQLLDRGLQLRDRRADVRQLDDVGLGCLHQLAELGKIVGLALLVREIFRKRRDDPARQGDIAKLDVYACGFRECLDDRQERIRRQRRRLIGVRVDDLCSAHGFP